MEVKYDAKFLINQFHIEMYNSLVYSPIIKKYLLIPRDRIDIMKNAEDIRDETKKTILKVFPEFIRTFTREMLGYSMVTGSDWSAIDRWRRFTTSTL